LRLRATRSGIVIGLALALLVPGSVVGQEASPSASPATTVGNVSPPPSDAPTLEAPLADPAGDITNAVTGEPVDGPGYADIVTLDAGVDKDREILLFFFETAESVVDMFGTEAIVDYSVLLDTDADGQADFTVDIKKDIDTIGWSASLTDVANGTTDGGEVSARVGIPVDAVLSVPLERLGSPRDVQVQAVLRSSWPTEGTADPASVVEGQDFVPDDIDEWLVVLSPPDSSAEAASPTPKTAKDLIKRKHPKVTLAAFEKAYNKMMKDPAAQEATPWTAAESRKTFKRCRNERSEGGRLGLCESMLRSALWAHTRTGSAESWAAAKKGYDYIYNTFDSKGQRKFLNEQMRINFEEPAP
jgi:hypothetical protein